MKKNVFLIILFSGVLVIILLILIFTSNKQCLNCQQNPELEKISQACFQENCFEVELAITPEEQQRGLMFREKLEENKGMLFIFAKEGIRGFWMKNTLIPLDIIWLNKNQKVVFIKKSAQPCGESVCLPIIPPQKAQYVLEINAGLTDKMRLEVGDTIFFKN